MKLWHWGEEWEADLHLLIQQTECTLTTETALTVETSFSLSLGGGLSAPMGSVEAGVQFGMGWTWSKSTSTTAGISREWGSTEWCGYWHCTPIMAHYSCGSVTQWEDKPGQLDRWGAPIRRDPGKYSRDALLSLLAASSNLWVFLFSPGMRGRNKKGGHCRKRLCRLPSDGSRVV
jgi:hypothetical protein